MTTTSSKKPNPLAAKPGTQGVDPRGPRFGATLTLITLTFDLILFLTESFTAGTILLAAITVVFAIGAFAGISRHPYGLIFKTFIRPRLKAPEELEDPKPPTFAQLIGFVISAVGLICALFGLFVGAIIAVAFAFIAAFLNSVFGYCLGCQIYVLLSRAGIVGRGSTAA